MFREEQYLHSAQPSPLVSLKPLATTRGDTRLRDENDSEEFSS